MRPFDEDAQPEHVTASAFASRRSAWCSHRHRLLGLWLQPGGHVEPRRGARRTPRLRELAEETGLVARAPRAAAARARRGARRRRGRTATTTAAGCSRPRSTDAAPGRAGRAPRSRWCAPDEAVERCAPDLRRRASRTAFAAARRLGLAGRGIVAGVNDALLALADHDEAHRPGAPRGRAPAVACRAHDAALAELAALRAAKRELDEQRAPLAARAAALERDAASARERAAVDRRAPRRGDRGGPRARGDGARARRARRARRAQLDDELLELLELLEPLDAQRRRRCGARRDARDRAARRARRRGRRGARRARRARSAALDARSAPRSPRRSTPRCSRATRRSRRAPAASAPRGSSTDGAARAASTVPAAIADQLVHGRDPDAIAVCDECGRLLVR